MRAILITRPGDPDVLQAGDIPLPDPAPHQIRVRVTAAGVNRADLLQRRSQYPPPSDVPANVPGLEYAGVVDIIGAAVSRWQTGDRVMGLVGGGAYAEAVVVHEDEAMPIPDAMSFEDAAAVPEAFLTAFDALRVRLVIERGEAVLIHAVGSGVGTAAAQLARQMGCRVIGTARSSWKLARVAALGVDTPIDASTQDFAARVLEETDGRGVEGIVDLVGGDYLRGNLAALAPRGRIVIVGLVAGRTAVLDMGVLLSRRATIVGTVMRSRSLTEKIAITQLFSTEILPWLEQGIVRPIVDRTLPMTAAAEAHRIMERNENFGNLVLCW